MAIRWAFYLSEKPKFPICLLPSQDASLFQYCCAKNKQLIFALEFSTWPVLAQGVRNIISPSLLATDGAVQMAVSPKEGGRAHVYECSSKWDIWQACFTWRLSCQEGRENGHDTVSHLWSCIAVYIIQFGSQHQGDLCGRLFTSCTALSAFARRLAWGSWVCPLRK